MARDQRASASNDAVGRTNNQAVRVTSHPALRGASAQLQPECGAYAGVRRVFEWRASDWRTHTRRVLYATAVALKDFLLPLACISCDRTLDASEPGVVCGRCWARLPLFPYPRCERCGHPKGAHRCTWCDLLPPYVRTVRSVCWVPDGIGGDLVHSLKYEGWEGAAPGMAIRMARLSWPEDVRLERSFTTSVPLARERERERGYNQSALLAAALAERWGIPYRETLERVRATESQTRLTPGDRLRNVAGAFVAAVPKATLAGHHVVLVDDVVTTAATLNSCASALFEGGARIISYVTFGRARAAGDRL